MTDRRYLPLLGYLALAAGVLSANLIAYDASQATDHRQLIEQRAGCERTNDLRAQINSQNKAFIHHNHITYSLFQDLSKTIPKDSIIYGRVRLAVAEYTKVEHSYTSLPLINCHEAYKADAR